MTTPRSPTSSPRVQDSSSNEENNTSCLAYCILTLIVSILLAFVALIVYSFIYTVMAIVNFSQKDVENVCPNSEIWWFALFAGSIWPFVSFNNVMNNYKDNEDYFNSSRLCVVFIYMAIMIIFAVWGHDQLYGDVLFANDECAKIHWQEKNTTEGAENRGHELYLMVELWWYIYLSISVAMGLMCLGTFTVIAIDYDFNYDKDNIIVDDVRPQSVPNGARRLSIREAESIRLKKILTGGDGESKDVSAV